MFTELGEPFLDVREVGLDALGQLLVFLGLLGHASYIGRQSPFSKYPCVSQRWHQIEGAIVSGSSCTTVQVPGP